MPRYQSDKEPTLRDGSPLLSANHVILLNVLPDLPDNRAPSHNAWLVAAFAYARIAGYTPNEWGLRKSVRTCRPEWVTRTRNGRAISVARTERGRAILERTIPAHVRGIGTYRGLRALAAG